MNELLEGAMDAGLERGAPQLVVVVDRLNI